MAIVKDFITRYGVYVQGTNIVTSSTGQTGALQVDGGAAIAKNLIVGTTATIHGPVFFKNAATIDGPTQINNIFTVTGNSFFNGDLTVTGNFGFSGALNLSNLTVTNFVVAGGGTFTSNSTSTFNAPVIISGGNTLTVGTGTTNLGGSLNVTGPLTINDLTPATVTPDGALVVAGGTYVGKNLIVASTNYNTGTNTSNALYVAGGAWIDKTLVVEGETLFKNSVTFNGTATYVYSTNTYYTDNIINLHTPPTGVNGAWTLDDGKDIGIVFHNYKGSDNDSFLGWANDTGYLEWYGSGLETAGTFTNASYGIFKTGGIRLTNTETAVSITSGALQSAGGIGAKNVWATNDVSGGTLTARNLTQGRIVFAGAGGQLTDDAELTYDALTNLLSADVSKATTATNIAGGGPGQIPYQSSVGVTEFVATGTSGYVLQSNGTSAPTWQPLTGITSGSATTATNIANGSANQLVYQISSGNTGFVGPGNAGQLLQSNGPSSPPTYVNTGNIYVGSAIKAVNLYGGSAGFIPMQSGADQTVFIEAGTAGQILQSNGTTATFVNTSTLYVGAAITADRWSNARTVTLSGDLTGSMILDGSASVTFTATIAADSVALGTDTTGDYVSNGATAGFGLSGSTTGEGQTFTVTINSTSSNTTSTVVYRDATGSFSASNIFSNGAQVVTTSTLNQYANQTFITAGTDTAVTTSSGNIVIWNTSTLQSVTDRGSITSNAIAITNSTNSTSTNSGALTVTGGAGIGGNVLVGGSITVGPTVTSSVVPAIYSNNVILASYTSPVITNNSPVNLDVYNASQYRTARYTIQIVDNSSIHNTEIMVTHNGTSAFISEYGIITNNGELGVFDAVLSGGNITLQFTPAAVTSMTIKVVRFGITA